MTFDEIIHKLEMKRKFYGMTYRDIADETGYSWSTHHKWERWKSRRGSRSVALQPLIDWAKALGLKVELVDDDEEG